ncbi:MAG: response regulator [Bdellovibrionaceae bacterium]|nr:response regulator [Pseudobdellovibrionaceae bacterium]
MKILIVDDEPLVRKSLSRACVAKGHEVVEAADGTIGLATWREQRPDLVFLDVLMPGLSGPQLLAEVGKFKTGQTGTDKTVVILMSAYSGEHNMETAQAMGAALFIPKPFDNIFDVVAKAEALFAERSTR